MEIKTEIKPEYIGILISNSEAPSSKDHIITCNTASKYFLNKRYDQFLKGIPVDFEVRNVLGLRFELGIPTDSHVVVPPMGLFFCCANLSTSIWVMPIDQSFPELTCLVLQS